MIMNNKKYLLTKNNIIARKIEHKIIDSEVVNNKLELSEMIGITYAKFNRRMIEGKWTLQEAFDICNIFNVTIEEIFSNYEDFN